jgi:uncharacterized protein (TIGR02271 family)
LALKRARRENLMSGSTDVLEWRGRTVVDRDGEKIGKLDEIYLDRETDEPEWALANTGLFGTKSSFVPLKGAEPDGDDVRVAYAKDQVKDAPSIDPDGELSRQEEEGLYRHYDVDYSKQRSGSGRPEATSPGTGGERGRDDAMTRSEEELRVGTAERERGRVRLKKHVVTEDVQETAPVRREEVRVEREPITDENVDEAMSGPDISEDEHEVTLKEEEVVVEKRTVPKERVRLEKDVETDEEQVSEQVRKEKVEVEDDR